MSMSAPAIGSRMQGLNVWSFPKSTGPFGEAAAGIDVVTTGLGVDRLLENLTIDPVFVEELRAELDAAAAKNISIHTLGFGSVPRWAEQRWPGIISGNFTQHGVSFDISSPGVPVLMRAGTSHVRGDTFLFFYVGPGCFRGPLSHPYARAPWWTACFGR